jgi:uncharacterized protein DUF4279
VSEAVPNQRDEQASMGMYEDDYPTCAETFAALRIGHAELNPEAMSQEIGIEPTVAWRRGDLLPSPGGGSAVAEEGVWMFASPEELRSDDARRHIDHVLDVVEAHATAISRLQAAGYGLAVSCYWVSRWGYGGPTLSARQMARLARFGLPLRIELYELQESEPLGRSVDRLTGAFPAGNR